MMPSAVSLGITFCCVLFSCVPSRLISGPCGEPLGASEPIVDSGTTVHSGEIAGYVLSPWKAERAVRLDSGAFKTTTDAGAFRFTNVAPGEHVLKTVALGFEPQYDTVIIRRNSGAFLMVSPRKRAVSLCTGR
jgi:hypothetical protein